MYMLDSDHFGAEVLVGLKLKFSSDHSWMQFSFICKKKR